MLSDMVDSVLFTTYCAYLPGEENPVVGINRVIVPFLACGDLSGFDSDKSYPAQVSSSHSICFVSLCPIPFSAPVVSCVPRPIVCPFF